MWNFTFRVRKQKIDRNGLAPIELTININRERSTLQLPMKIQPSEFERLRASKKANYINTYCEHERVKVYRTVTQLQAMGREAGIEKKLHSHLFRNTFAHHQLNERHLNLATVSKLLGHTNLKQTQHYYQKHTSTILEEFALANDL